MADILKPLILTTLAASCATNCCAFDYDAVPTAGQAVLDDRYPARTVSFANGVTSLADVVYATQPGFQPLKLDVYLPPASGAPHPGVLVIHGGGWISGHSRHSGAFADWPGTLAALASEGYVVASLNYRLSGEAPFPAAIQDVKAAIKFMRANAAAYHLDPTRIATWGGSAGGQLAALAAVSCGVSELEPTATIPGVADNATVSDCVQGAVAWYGVFDFSPMVPTDTTQPSPVTQYLDCSQRCAEHTVHMASAQQLLDKADPPMLLIHGIDDAVVPVAQSQNFHAAAEQSGVATSLVLIPKVNHSFIGATPEVTRAASLEALEATVNFFNATLSKQ
ncbi:MAG: alpha/beta hydrolase [Gammaproteobacteria bacterium]|nr:alpha/beta hydrolase [Gammaproteobacteria bacterium]